MKSVLMGCNQAMSRRLFEYAYYIHKYGIIGGSENLVYLKKWVMTWENDCGNMSGFFREAREFVWGARHGETMSKFSILECHYLHMSCGFSPCLRI